MEGQKRIVWEAESTDQLDKAIEQLKQLKLGTLDARSTEVTLCPEDEATNPTDDEEEDGDGDAADTRDNGEAAEDAIDEGDE